MSGPGLGWVINFFPSLILSPCGNVYSSQGMQFVEKIPPEYVITLSGDATIITD